MILSSRKLNSRCFLLIEHCLRWGTSGDGIHNYIATFTFWKIWKAQNHCIFHGELINFYKICAKYYLGQSIWNLGRQVPKICQIASCVHVFSCGCGGWLCINEKYLLEITLAWGDGYEFQGRDGGPVGFIMVFQNQRDTKYPHLWGFKNNHRWNL